MREESTKIVWGLLVGVLCACSSQAQNVTTVQSAGTGRETSEPSISLAFSQSTTAGNTIIVAVDSGTPITQVRDSLGNSYVKDLGPIGNRSYIFRASNIAGGSDTVTAVFTSPNRGSSIHIVEYSGLAPAPFDGASGANGYDTAVNCARVTTSNPNDLLVVYARVKYVIRETDPNYASTDTEFDNWLGERRVNGAGTYSASFRQEPGGTFECLLAAYKIGSGGGGGNPLQITTTTVPNGTVGTAYSATLAASGGTAPYTWSVSAGSLPSGLNLASTGRIDGTPTTAGTYTFTAQVRDAASARATKSFSLTMNPAGSPLQITTTTVPNGTVGTAYTTTLAASGGTPPYTWSVNSGSLPPGLNLASTGQIDGTPTSSGSYPFTAQVRDSAGATATRNFSFTIDPGNAHLNVSPSSVDFGNVVIGNTGSQTVTLSNSGSASLTVSDTQVSGTAFSITGLALPLTLTGGHSSTFTVRFTPLAQGGASGSISFVSTAPNSPLMLPLSGTGVPAVSHSIQLSWEASSSTVVGYNVYRATVSGGPYTKLNSSPIGDLSYTDSTVESGRTYHYVVTAVDQNSVESSFSNEAKVTIP